MNKNLAWLSLPLFLASCGLFGGDRSDSTESEPEETMTTVENQVELDQNVEALSSASDWGKDRSSLLAKTIEWSHISTPAQATYLARSVVIDQIQRHDADDFYGIRVRLGNRTSKTINVEYLVRFYNGKGQALISLHEGYRSAILPARGTALVLDTARARGAVGFRLFVRKKTSNEVGYPDADLTWLNGPQSVTTWLNGIVFVDNLFQDNPAGTNRVMFRLGAKSVEPVNIEYRISFQNDQGNLLQSDHEEFRALTLSADREASILNTCRQPGASGYRLFIRAAGTQAEGRDDQSVPTETSNQ